MYGIMTITGFVDSERIQILDEYQGVTLLDLTANKIQSEISDLVVELEQFAIPNPAWLIYASNVNATE